MIRSDGRRAQRCRGSLHVDALFLPAGLRNVNLCSAMGDISAFIGHFD